MDFFPLKSFLNDSSVVLLLETDIETPCVCESTRILLAALLKAISHHSFQSVFLWSIPALSNFNFGFNASVIPVSFLPRPLPVPIQRYVQTLLEVNYWSGTNKLVYSRIT